MKKYFKLAVATLFLIMLTGFIPKLIDNSIQSAEAVYPQSMVSSDDISASGVIEESVKKEVYVELPVVPQSVNFEVGDKINANDIIAEVDTNATQAAIFQMIDSSRLIPTEYLEAFKSINVNEDMLKSYVPTQIVSPISGVITEMNLLTGAIAMPKTLACTISKTDEMRVKMSVDEVSADKIKNGDTVVFKASATGNIKYSGKVSLVFPTASKVISGTSQVTAVSFYVDLDQKYERLKPGYTVSGVIKKDAEEKLITIPYEAVLQDENNNEYVYVYEDSRVTRRDIITGDELTDRVEVKSGLNKNELVIKDACAIKNEKLPVKIRQ